VEQSYEFKRGLLIEHGAYVSFGARRILITPAEIDIETYARDHYVFRRSDGYRVTLDRPRGGLGRASGLLQADGSPAPIWFGADRARALAALEDCGWDVELPERNDRLSRFLSRFGRY